MSFSWYEATSWQDAYRREYCSEPAVKQIVILEKDSDNKGSYSMNRGMTVLEIDKSGETVSQRQTNFCITTTPTTTIQLQLHAVVATVPRAARMLDLIVPCVWNKHKFGRIWVNVIYGCGISRVLIFPILRHWKCNGCTMPCRCHEYVYYDSHQWG